MRDIAKEKGFRGNYNMFGRWRFNSSTDIAHIKVSEGLIYSVDGILDTATIEYGTPEAIQKQIGKLNSEIRFMQDVGEDSWTLRRLESQRDSFVSYQRQLQYKKAIEPSLEELEQQKHILEALDKKTMELLEEYNKEQENEILKINGIDIDFFDD